MNNRLNKLLHALAGEVVTQQYAHDYLRTMGKNLFNRCSVKDLTDAEAKIIAEKLRKEINAQHLALYNARNTGIEKITVQQIITVKQLQRELGWSDDYLQTLIQRRYDEERIETMPAWKAYRLINYLIERKRQHIKRTHTRNA